MPSVLGYLREVLVPYYKEVLTLPTKDNRTDDVVTVGGPVFSAFLEVCNSQVCAFNHFKIVRALLSFRRGNVIFKAHVKLSIIKFVF